MEIATFIAAAIAVAITLAQPIARLVVGGTAGIVGGCVGVAVILAITHYLPPGLLASLVYSRIGGIFFCVGCSLWNACNYVLLLSQGKAQDCVEVQPGAVLWAIRDSLRAKDGEPE